MNSMQLSLGEGWTQVEPRETPFELLMANQPPGQRLLLWDTGFGCRRDLGFSGGKNCPLAVDETGDRVFVSVDGIVSYGIRGNNQDEYKIDDDFSVTWMLEYFPKGPELLVHLAGGDPWQGFIGWVGP
jgi:hypothetical protein